MSQMRTLGPREGEKLPEVMYVSAEWRGQREKVTGSRPVLFCFFFFFGEGSALVGS